MTTRVPQRVVTFGELMLRLSPPGSERLFQTAELRAGFGGCEANVAVALAHLGLRADYVTRLPANPLGDAALRALKEEGVGTEWIARGGARLGVYFVEPGADLRAARVLYDRAGSAFSEIGADPLDWASVLAGATWFHGSGITPALGGGGPGAALGRAVAIARAQGVAVSIDLNYRPALWHGRDPRPLIDPLVRHIDLLIGNRDAARAMLGIEADGPGLAARLAERYQCRRVAVTYREVVSASEHEWSALLYEAATGALTASRRYRVRVVDRVGGGDAFAAGLIAAFLEGRADADAVEFAAAAGALKLTIPGDFSRATRDQIERLAREVGDPCT